MISARVPVPHQSGMVPYQQVPGYHTWSTVPPIPCTIRGTRIKLGVRMNFQNSNVEHSNASFLVHI